MIFYHVLAHIDFFQNNLYFRHTWDYDFNGRALSDKRIISKLRSEKGRWVDYVIEFTRGIDNLVGYHDELSRLNRPPSAGLSLRIDFYFDMFLQEDRKAKISDYVKEIERYNSCLKKDSQLGEQTFFSEVEKKHPEFDSLFKKHMEKGSRPRSDLIQFLMEHSMFLNKEENTWMKSVMQVVRDTSIFFQPQIRTKIMNEGWASYWHETLFLSDERIQGHEVDFARVNAGVTSMPKVGLNPYALGMRMFYYIEEMAEKGRHTYNFERLLDADRRKFFDDKTGKGRQFIFQVRENLCDFLFIHQFLDQDFINRHNLFIAGKRLNKDRMVWEYYIKSRKAEAYRKMIKNSLYHPPHIDIVEEKCKEGNLYLNHHFEGKSLVTEFIANTLIGIAYLWGGPVQLETSEVASISPAQKQDPAAGPLAAEGDASDESEVKWRRVLYTMRDQKLSKVTIK
jgi:stage V sporulation protein R